MEIQPSKPKIIAFSGTHGTGKSTSCYEKAYQLKLSQKTEVGIILEVARQCPYPICSKENAIPTAAAQLWVFSAQMQAELNATRRYGCVVSDRTLIDTIAYTAAAGMYSLAYAMREIATVYARTAYKEIHFRTINDHDYLVDDGIRNLSYDFRREVESAMLTLYSELGINLIYHKKE
jgi:predicted ATPase